MSDDPLRLTGTSDEDFKKFSELPRGHEFPAVLSQGADCEAGDYLIHVGRHLFGKCPARYADAIALTKSNVGHVLVRKL